MLSQEVSRLRKKINLFTGLTFLLTGIIIIIISCAVVIHYRGDFSVGKLGQDAPYQEEVKKIIEPLRYSGIAALMSPDVKISLNFPLRLWVLHNIHRFDENGKVVLAEGRYGLCGDLAAYCYDRLKPLFGAKYKLEFVQVCESGYFLDPRASHIALFITEPLMFGIKTYILDPSFQRYAKEEDLDEYLLFKKTEELNFVKNKNTDEIFSVSALTPLVIKKDFLVGLMVDEQNGKFDKDNFIITLTATQRFKFAGRYIFALRRIAGQTEILENKHLAYRILGEEMYRKLKLRIEELYAQL